jgi:SAM-dependent methyltransferase
MRQNPSAQYDQFADTYADGGPFNELYERPAILELLGNVQGLNILDAGCGSGVLTERLKARGATLTGIDASKAMLKRARDRLGPNLDLRVHDLHNALTWIPDESLDVVVASLVMHYLKDWAPTLAEFHRVLRPTGRFVFSTHHPFADYTTYNRPDYFALEEIADQWSTTGVPFKVRFWRRPLSAIVDALFLANFEIHRLAEPRPFTLTALPHELQTQLTTEPWFLFVVATPR